MKKLFLICAVIFLGVMPAYAGIDAGLIAYYPFSGNADDESGNGNDGTVNDAVLTEDRDGNPNSAYRFRGGVGFDDFIEIDNAPSQQISGDNMTVCAWIWLEDDVTYNTQQRIVAKYQTIERTWGLGIFGDGHNGATGNNIAFHDSNGSEWHYSVATAEDLVPQRWYHVAAVDSGGTITIYLNGSPVHEDDEGHGIPSTINAAMVIGRGGETLDAYYFDGVIDEVRVYNRVLSADEIRDARDFVGTIGPPDVTTTILPDTTTTTSTAAPTTTSTTAAATTTTTTVPDPQSTTTTSTAEPASTTTTAPDDGEITVDFAGIPTSGPAPLEVDFYNLCEGPAVEYLWNFGDGAVSDEENPTHTYTAAGSYKVCLHAYAADGDDTVLCKEDYIRASRCPLAAHLENPDDVQLLRSLRDRFLKSLPGMVLVSLYYQHSAEISSLLDDDPGLHARLNGLLKRHRSAAERFVRGAGGRINEAALHDAVDFLSGLRAQASPALRAALDFVVQGIESGSVPEE